MGNKTGFIDHKQVSVQYRDTGERIQDWNEIAVLPSEQVLAEQASRCMDCAVPFCQDGSILGGMTTGCPIYNLIPEWNDLVYNGRWQEAYERLKVTNPFPEFTGRACPAPCEGACVATLAADAVTIKNIERAIIDKAFEEGWVRPAPPTSRTGKHVAIIGSGPAGLASAVTLNQQGHQVTVYEQDDRAGGLLTYGIPKTKIEQHVVDRRINLLEAEGIEFIVNTEVGKDVSFGEIKAAHDAVIVCIGAAKPRDTEVAGREAAGIHFAMDYLHENTKQILHEEEAEKALIHAKGKDVIVIGGGDTATDCITTAIRQNCKSLAQFDIYPMKPASRTTTNPWPQYPVIHKVDSGQEEATHVFGKDPRAFATTVQEFIHENGKLTGVKSAAIEMTYSETGEKNRTVIPGTEKIWPAQLVLLAIGFEGPERELPEAAHIPLNKQSNIKVKRDTFQTETEGVFAAGDAKTGASLIVWAIQEGKEAAADCHHYLTQEK